MGFTTIDQLCIGNWSILLWVILVLFHILSIYLVGMVVDVKLKLVGRHARHASKQAVYRLDSTCILEQRKIQHKDHSKNQINVNIIRFLRRYQIEDSRPCLLSFSVHK